MSDLWVYADHHPAVAALALTFAFILVLLLIVPIVWHIEL